MTDGDNCRYIKVQVIRTGQIVKRATKMKILCLVTLLVCANAQGADLDDEIVVPDFVDTRLEDTHLELNLLSADSDVTKDDQLLMSEIETLEEQYGRNLVTDAIENMLEEFREVIINGNDVLPPLDPLVIPIIGPFDHSSLATGASATVKNLRAEGLRWFVLDNITFNPVRLSFAVHVTIPWFTVTGAYEARARLGLLTHTAGGNFRVFAHRIEFGLDMRLGTNIFGGGHLILRELDIKIDIHDTHIQIHGLTGSNVINSFISGVVQGVTQELIQSEMENVSKLLSEVLFDVINETLKEFTINDILGM